MFHSRCSILGTCETLQGTDFSDTFILVHCELAHSLSERPCNLKLIFGMWLHNFKFSCNEISEASPWGFMPSTFWTVLRFTQIEINRREDHDNLKTEFNGLHASRSVRCGLLSTSLYAFFLISYELPYLPGKSWCLLVMQFQLYAWVLHIPVQYQGKSMSSDRVCLIYGLSLVKRAISVIILIVYQHW